jgi:TonB family protein
MPVPRKLVFFLVLVSAPAWTQMGSQGEYPGKSATQTPQTSPDSAKTLPTDQTSPASSQPDSTTLVAIKTEKAFYPYEARDKKIQGEVVLKILVSEAGDVESAEVVSGDPILGKSAIEAVKKWKFKPFIKNGKAIKVSTKLPIDFAFSAKIMEKGVSADGSATSDSKTPQTSAASPALPDGAAIPEGATKRVRVASNVSRGMLTRQVAPVYPDAARHARIEGTVVLQAIISKDGWISDLKIISGPKELAPAAIGAVQQWRYRPYLLMGEPVEAVTTVQVNFQLR